MSTYQYYEFLAVDGPISDEGLEYAHRCSSRAEVSRYRWVNSYHWGDFSGSEETLLKYYDAFYYFADWGSFRFALAFPVDGFIREAVEPYLRNDGYDFGASLTCSLKSDRIILRWDFQEDGVCWDDPIDISGILGRLFGIRGQILRGDYRALFIGWLAGFDSEEDYSEEEVMPPIPAGMEALSGGLRCLADQMQLDEDAVQAAVEFTRGCRLPEPLPVADVVGELSAEEMRELLTRVVEGDEGRVKAELIKRTVPQVTGEVSERISCRAFAERMLQAEEQRKKSEKKKVEMKRLAEERLRREHLARIFAESDARWKLLDNLLVKKTASVYNTVAWRVEELRDAYVQADESKQFAEHLSVFRSRYENRPALMRRIKEISISM